MPHGQGHTKRQTPTTSTPKNERSIKEGCVKAVRPVSGSHCLFVKRPPRFLTKHARVSMFLPFKREWEEPGRCTVTGTSDRLRSCWACFL